MELIKNISLKTLIPFVLAFIAILAFHFSVDLTTDDYKYFRIYAFGYYEQGDVASFLQWRYATWTSRLLIEFFTFWFVQFPLWAFSIVDSLIILAITAMTYLLFSKKRSIIYATLAIIITFMYKITDMSSAGYLVTIIVYLWPLAAFLPTLFPFKRTIENNNESHKWPAYVVSSICAIFCCNCEQICVAAIMIWGSFVLYTYLQNKQIDKLYCILLIIAFAHLIIITTCPGNSERTLVEISRIPYFEQYSFVKKTILGIASPVVKYMIPSKQSIIVWCFSLVLPISMYLKNRRINFPLFISIVPLLILGFSLSKVFPLFIRFIETSVSTKDLAVISAISIVFYFCILFSLYYISRDQSSLVTKYGPAYLFFVGLTTRACLGITTSFQETARTYFLLEYAMIALSIILISQNISKWADHKRTER